MKKIILIASLLLLSSCMKLDSEITIGSSGVVDSKASIDMAQFVTLMESFGSGMNSNSVNKDLCKDENFSSGLSEGIGKAGSQLENLKCTSLGDYKAQVSGTLDYSHKKGILFLSGGVIVADLVTLGDSEGAPLSDQSASSGGESAEKMGFSMSQKYIFPGKISFSNIGIVSSGNTLTLNLLDPKVLGSHSLIVIVTPDGRSLSKKEINMYKLQLRKHNRRAK